MLFFSQFPIILIIYENASGGNSSKRCHNVDNYSLVYGIELSRVSYSPHYKDVFARDNGFETIRALGGNRLPWIFGKYLNSCRLILWTTG